MKERPILFSGEMIRAILDGRKTQTRRVVKPQPDFSAQPKWASGPGHAGEGWYCGETEYPEEGSVHYRCPYGTVGDSLWVRETWACRIGDYDAGDPLQVLYRADNEVREIDPDSVLWEKWADKDGWTPSIFMPRWASRINLEVTGVRVERVQEISEEDAAAEGVQLPIDKDGHPLVRISGKYPPCQYADSRREGESVDDTLKRHWTFRTHFASLWDSINAKRGYSWDSSPFVWVVEFKRLT